MYGLLEVITMMLALSGFGVDQNKKAPTGDAVLEYAVEDADAMVHVDLAAVGPRNYKALLALPDDPLIKASPALLDEVKRIKVNVEGVRGMAKAVAGIDVVEDLSSVTVFLDLDPQKDPVAMAVVRGTFPADFVKKIAKPAGGKTGSVDGRDTLQIDADMLLGMTKSGVLIVGPRAWVEPRIDDDWKAPKRARGSAAATVASYLDARPWFLAALRVDDKAASALAKEAGDNVIGDLVAGHELAILALHHDGFAMHWKDRSAAGLDRVALMTDGMIELMRAAHVAPRGIAKIVIAALPSYAGKDKELDQLLARKDDLLKVVNEYTGDGKFKVDVKKSAKARTLSVRATGKSFSDVVPAAMLVPFGALFMVAEASPPQPPVRATPAKPAPARPVPARKPVPPRKGGGLKPKP